MLELRRRRVFGGAAIPLVGLVTGVDLIVGVVVRVVARVVGLVAALGGLVRAVVELAV